MRKHLDGIGEVSFRKSHKARRISLKIHTGRMLEVILPNFTSYAQAEKFVLEKKSWIVKNKKKFALETIHNNFFLPTTDYKTR